MAFTYPTAPTVASGDPIQSPQAYAQADAVNARLKLGPSCPWHLVYYLLSAFRQVRNPEGSLSAPQGEFFTVYQNASPDDIAWPLAGPGDPEGCNVASQMPLFVFGGDTPGIASEADRLTDPAQGGLDLDLTDPIAGACPRGIWQAAKRQRGAWDADSGALGSPALLAAVSHGFIRYGATSPHGVDFGGYLPSPIVTGNCAGDGSDNAPPQNRQIVFTKLDGSGTTLTYGTCPENPGDLAGIYQTPFFYLLFFYSGAVTRLPALLWVEGPYTGNPALRKTQNYFLDRAINSFNADFRGTPDQRATNGLGNAFNFQTFLTNQYLLAPQRGHETNGTVSPIYRTFELRGLGVIAAGSIAPQNGAVSSRFIVTSFYVEAKGLNAPCAVWLTRDGVSNTSVDLALQKDGTWQGLAVLGNQTPGGTWGMTLGTDAKGPGLVILKAEITELMVYKPSVADAYLVLRCGAALTSGPTDGDGTRCAFADQIAQRYFETGAISNLPGSVAIAGQVNAINDNAVFDAARRLSQCVRWIPRDNLVGYEVSGGVSILYFKRLAYGLGNDTPIDLFQGIAPARKPVTTIKWGRKYVVQGTSGQTLTYGQKPYAVGQTFTGDGVNLKVYGEAQAWEVEGIRHIAEPADFTNEWLVGCELLPHKQSSSSIWKPEAFADVIGPLNRCLFGDPGAAIDNAVCNHLAFGNRSLSPAAILEPEAPDAFNYLPVETGSYRYTRANQIQCADGDTDCTANRPLFYQSCRLFEPWPEVDSVTIDSTDIVKVKLKARIHSCPSAPASISRDATTWSASTIAAEPFRSWENGIREYLVFNLTGNPGSSKIGDQAWASGVRSGFTDIPSATNFPRFYFVQQIPKPRVDGDGVVDLADSPTYHDIMRQTELYLRAICSAFVDGVATSATACTTNTAGPYDFTFESLVYQATGGKWFSTLATKPTQHLTPSDVRPDKPMGFSALPTVTMHAEGFTAISKALNLLTRFRVMIPATLQFRNSVDSHDYTDANAKNANYQVVPPGTQTAGGAGVYAIWDQGSWAMPAPANWTDWFDASTGTGGAGVNGMAIVGGVGVVSVGATACQYRWTPQPDADLALPAQFSGMLTSNPVIYGTYNVATVTVLGPRIVGHRQGTQVHQFGDPADAVWDNDLGAFFWVIKNDAGTPVCQELSGGDLSVPSVPAGYTFGSRNEVGTITLVYSGNNIQRSVNVVQTTIPVIGVQLVAATAPTLSPVL